MAILDGTSPTGAWSMYRDLLTSFVGGTRYTTATGVNSFNDQTGNARHFTQTTAADQPAVTTAGPNSRTCADFDGSSHKLFGSNTGVYITNSAGYIVVSFIADTIEQNSTTSYNNDAIVGANSGYIGLLLRNTGTPASILAANWDGADTKIQMSAAITLGTMYVAEWRHEGGTLYLRLNGGTEVSVASGNTTNVTTQTILASSYGTSSRADIKIFDLATWSTVPALATRDAIVADFMAQPAVEPDARVTQSALEQFITTEALGQGTQVGLEMWSSTATITGQAFATQAALEMWASVAEVSTGVSNVKVWSGSAWVPKPLKIWNGSAWV